MTINRTATRAGKKYESDLMKYIRARNFDVERLRLTGAEDEGDLVVSSILNNPQRYIVEAKREKGFNLAGWIKEAQAERINYAKHRLIPGNAGRYPGFVVVHHARGKHIGQSYVTTTLDEWLGNL